MLRFNLEFALSDEAFSIAGNQSGKAGGVRAKYRQKSEDGFSRRRNDSAPPRATVLLSIDTDLRSPIRVDTWL
jgi:hypothetical protein